MATHQHFYLNLQHVCVNFVNELKAAIVVILN